MRRGLAVLALIGGLAALLFGLRGGTTSLRPRPSQPVTETPQQSIDVNTSPVAAVDPRRPEVMAVAGRVDAPRLNCTVAVTTTGGDAWRALDLPTAPGADNCFWPAVAFDGDGNLLVLYTPTGGPFNLPTALWLQRFTPELAPDGPPIRVGGALTFQPRLAVDGRRVLVAWIAATEERATKSLGFGSPPNPIVLARSDDGGRTFAPPVTVSEPNRLAVQPTLLAGPGGQVVIGALDLVDDRSTYQTAHEGRPGPPPAGPWRLVLWRSGDGGATFSPPATVAEGVVPAQRVLIDLAPAPDFALDPARGRVYAAWESGRDVMVSRSDDAGATWSPGRRVGPTAGGQFLPGVAVAPDGRVDVAYYDRSRDPADVLAEVVLASSTDGGKSFATGVLSERFDSMVGSFNGDDVMLGSHLAVIAQAGATTVIWPDTTRGNRTTNVVDLVSATVEVKSGAGARVPVMAGGVLLIVAAIALLLPGSALRRGAGPARRRPAWPPPSRRD